MRYLILFFSLINPIVCCANESPKHVIVAGKVRGASANKIAKKYGLQICGFGGAMMDSVKEIGVDFMVYRPLKKEEARELLVKCVEEFLDDINNDVELRPYLATYPFDAGHITISLYSEVPQGKDVCFPYFSIVSSHKGKIHYLGRLLEADKFCKHKETETFEEARSILKVQPS